MTPSWPRHCFRPWEIHDAAEYEGRGVGTAEGSTLPKVGLTVRLLGMWTAQP